MLRLFIQRKVFSFFVIFILLGFAATSARAATFEFNPSSDALKEGCKYSLNIEVDASGQSSNAADIEVSFDPAKVDIIDSNTNIPGTQVKNGNAYETYVFNEADESSGIIRVAATSFMSELNSRKIFATIEFEAKSGVTSAQFNIKFDGVGDTLDSNVADSSTSLDLLTGVTNGSYTFTTGYCVADTTPPYVRFITPTNGQRNVPLTSNVDIQVTDARSGVDLDTCSFDINGDLYLVSDPQVAYSGDSSNYRFIINPTTDFPDGTASMIRVICSDLAGNRRNSSILFNVPQASPPPPQPPEPPEECEVCEECVIPEPPEPPEVPECEECSICSPTAGLTDTCGKEIINLFEDEDALKNTFLEDTVVDKMVENLGVPGTTAILTGFPMLLLGLLSLLPYLSLLNAPGFFQDLWAIFVGAKRKPWGLIISATTGEPLGYAICAVYYSESDALIARAITDSKGRYSLNLQPGNYRMEVSCSGYEKAQATFTVNEQSGSYAHDFELYPIGSQVEVAEGQSQTWINIREKIRVVWKYTRIALFVIGFISSVVGIIFKPSVMNVILIIFYGLVVVAFILTKFRLKSPSSMVVNASTKLKVPFAQIKVYDVKTGEVVDAQTSNEKGEFDFWGESGEYAINVTKHGYYFLTDEQSVFESVEIGGAKMLKMYLKQGKNDLKLYIQKV